ncbi:hypothetical protein [uncultured Desulfuromusa sp.]|uniref:hypothetical protein n=1 Tax=uncultured Desulfuromusa sp. TaxID=219183 RepID=UPI002AA5EC34|nr:hypothetical protein [uncultured Desulfuromusa sp.]
MTPALDFKSSDSSIGLITRQPRSGPENDLIDCFIERELPRLRGLKGHYALFCEPQLDTGFPDIVIASYNPRIYEDWRGDRSKLTLSTIKLLQYLHYMNGADSECIERQIGITSKSLVRSLEQLLDAGLVRWRGKRWVPKGLRSSYGISKIVAIEAKMNNWKEVFRQAEHNKWFASESYVLSPVENPQAHILKRSVDMGIGIYSMPNGKRAKKIRNCTKGELPLSYASWLFNEWVGRRLNC